MLHGAGYLPTVTTMEHMAYIPMIIPMKFPCLFPFIGALVVMSLFFKWAKSQTLRHHGAQRPCHSAGCRRCRTQHLGGPNSYGRYGGYKTNLKYGL